MSDTLATNNLTRAQVVHWKIGVSNIGRAVCAIGAFDGVHLGHQFLIRSMCDKAREVGVPSVIVPTVRSAILSLEKER